MTAINEPIISVRDTDKFYTVDGGTVEALTNVNLDVQEGEFISLLGPSGCGKTTLLNVIAGLIPASNGTVRFRGEVHNQPRSEFGVMFQSPVLLPWRNVEDNVKLPAEIFKLDADVVALRVKELLHLVGLEGFERKFPSQLSGGMAQRVALCRLLAFDPDVLLMDEPFGALDEFTREAMDIELLRIWSATKKTVLFVTHNITEAVLLADRVVVMSPRPGRIAEIVTPDLDRPRSIEMLDAEPLRRAVHHIREGLGSVRAA